MRNVIRAAFVAAATLVAAVPLAGCDAEAAEPTQHPEVLAAELGVWRSKGWVSDGRSGSPLEAAWKCERRDGGENRCKWRLMSREPLLGAERFDPALAKFMYTLAPVAPGIMHGHWEFTDDGASGVGVNEVRIVSAREWRQHTAIDIDGKRVLELNLTHRRIR